MSLLLEIEDFNAGLIRAWPLQLQQLGFGAVLLRFLSVVTKLVGDILEKAIYGWAQQKG